MMTPAPDELLALADKIDPGATHRNIMFGGVQPLRDAAAFLRLAATQPSNGAEAMRDALNIARDALIKIRGCSIAGANEGYVKPELWGQNLFRSHADVAHALKVIAAAIDKAEPAGETQSSDGGVDGHEAMGRWGATASDAPRAGIKPGPSEAQAPVPVGYAVYGIGGGKTYLHDVKQIEGDEWKIDDSGLGDYWSGNEPLYLAPPAAKAVDLEAIKAAQLAVEQAIDCIRGETPEDISREEAEIDTISKLREASRAIAALLNGAR